MQNINIVYPIRLCAKNGQFQLRAIFRPFLFVIWAPLFCDWQCEMLKSIHFWDSVLQDLYLKHFRGNFSWFSSWPQQTTAESTHKLCQLKIVQNIAFKNEWTLDYKWYVITHPSLFPLTLLQQWKEKARQERQFVKFRLEFWSKFNVFHPYSNQNSWRIQLSSDFLAGIFEELW